MEQIKIVVNGCEKVATGLTKETTVDDIKFAMLYSSVGKFKVDMLNDYGLFEQWHTNERLLDSNVKIYKIIKLWKQLPGDQLAQVKFVIKQKLVNKKTSLSINKNQKEEETNRKKEFKYCSLSPSVQKTWNDNLVEKRISRTKSSYVRKQLEILNQKKKLSIDDNHDLQSIPSSAWSSGHESESDDETSNSCKRIVRKRYASIKRMNKSRNSSIKRINAEQNEIEQQEHKLKLNKINNLRNELKTIQKELLNVKQNSKLDKQEEDNLGSMRLKLSKIDDMILVKTKLIESLENELKRMNEMNNKKCEMTSSCSSSSISSTDTGISSAHSDQEEEIISNNRFETLV
ncbi:unnamed protein product [Brachionus calyciflorus]|uniref:Ras-associating domain-containing protein n=1 Tax=Brachionus calyciflorus TaxID=104777 RepID=A0A813ZZC4_9BILA|nr:unnamed protein product [Brachionus calyciflorus]